MRLSWFSGPPPGRRRAARRRRCASAPLRVRRLERRRVLDAAVQSLAVMPSVATETQEPTETLTVSDQEALFFDWSATADSSGSAAAQQASGAVVLSDEFSNAPTDGSGLAADPYAVESLHAATAQSASLVMANGAAPNVRPVVFAPDQEVDEGVLLNLSGIGAPTIGIYVDAGPDPITATIDWGDGSPLEAATIFAVPPAGVLGGMHTYADNGTYTATVSVMDGSGAIGSDEFIVTVNNVAPTAVLGNNGPVDEGSGATVSFSGQFDPGTVDTAAGFHYAYDLDNDGTFDIGDGTYLGSVTADSQAVAASFLAEGPGMHTVKARIIDKNGEFNDYFTDIDVMNVAPELINIAGDTINENEFAMIEATIDDPGASDVFSVDVDWMDGSTATITGLGLADSSGTVGDTRYVWTAMSRKLELIHRYLDDGPGPADGMSSYVYSVELNVTDDDLDASDPYHANVRVNNLPPVLRDQADQEINEGELLDLSAIGAPILGLFVDDGTIDTHVATINWGDGTIENATIIPFMGGGVLGGKHVYADDGLYTVTLMVTDDDGGVSVPKTLKVMVNNVRPTLTPAGPQTIDEGSPLSITNIGTITDPGFQNSVLGTDELFRFWIDWGDGTAADLGQATIDDIGGLMMDLTDASFDGTHTYADNGTYTVRLRVADDDMTAYTTAGLFETGTDGQDFVESMTITVIVANVDPTLTGTNNLVLNEGQVFTLTGLGVAISDPGFDNPANVLDPSNGGETQETFEVMQIDWGDGTVDAVTPMIANRQSPQGGPTTADLTHFNHAYADGGPDGTDYEVTITLKDDDGGFVKRTFTIHVENVAPTLTLTNGVFVINEGQLLSLPGLGSFTDPGFTDPINGSVETFTYTIEWGDGAVQTFQLPATVTNGSRPTMVLPKMLTSGTLANQHFYADNDSDNIYTITVTLSDDDGGSHTQSFDITVFNVNPTLQPVTATDVESTGRTTLNLSFSDPGADTFQVLVDWGDRLNLPPDQRFVVETVHAGPTPASFTLEHFYTGPPDPNNPSADITITVKIFDDDALVAGVVQPGISNLESATISNPGIEVINAAIDTSPNVPRLDFIPPAPLQVLLDQQSSSLQSLQSPDTRVASSELALTSDRYLELVVISPEGIEIESHRLKDEALLDLRGLIATLPDGRYKIVLVRTDNNSRRLVMEVYVRRGRVIDPSDDSEGTRDRPPTSETSQPVEAVPLDENPLLEPLPNGAQPIEEPDGDPQAVNGAALPDDGGASSLEHAVLNVRSLQWAVPLAGLALTAGRGGWSQRLGAALELADARAWQRLRRAGRLGKRPFQFQHTNRTPESLDQQVQ